VEHEGATEDYAEVLAEMRAQMAEGLSVTHVDGDGCRFAATIVWRCVVCGREQCQDLSGAHAAAA
jgi:hypothetical protein